MLEKELSQTASTLHWLRTALIRASLIGLFWLTLTGTAGVQWLYLIPVIVVATACSLALVPPRTYRASRFRWIALLPLLAWYSLKGGFDVAVRALRPDLPIRPDLVRVPLSFADPSIAIVATFVLTLLPGTLVVNVDEDGVDLHVIDSRLPIAEVTRRVSHHLNWAFQERAP